MGGNKIKVFVATAFVVGCGVFFILYILTHLENIDLQATISTQNKLIERITKNDSIYTAKNKNYSKVIEKYTDSTSFIIDGKEFTSDQFIKLYNKINIENQMREDSIQQYKRIVQNLVSENKTYQDSSFLYRELYKFSKKKYNFNIAYKKDSVERGSYILFTKSSKADSAAILYRYFKNRIKEISPGVYEVTTSDPK